MVRENFGNMGITATSRLQLIDFACCKRDADVVLRKEEGLPAQDFETRKRKLQTLWRNAVSLTCMKLCWFKMCKHFPKFSRTIYQPIREKADRARRLCHDFLEEYADPETDIQAVLDAKMFSDME